jgi:hypothetical protein
MYQTGSPYISVDKVPFPMLHTTEVALDEKLNPMMLPFVILLHAEIERSNTACPETSLFIKEEDAEPQQEERWMVPSPPESWPNKFRRSFRELLSALSGSIPL